MTENSKIEWTTHTFNPWRGCTKVAAGRLLDGREWSEFPQAGANV